MCCDEHQRGCLSHQPAAADEDRGTKPADSTFNPDTHTQATGYKYTSKLAFYPPYHKNCNTPNLLFIPTCSDILPWQKTAQIGVT